MMALLAGLKKNYIKKLRTAAPNNPMLVEFASLPYEWQKNLIQVFGEPQEQARQSIFAQHYVLDSKANDFFTNYTYGDNIYLPADRIKEYTINASVLNTVIALKADRKAKCKSIRMSTKEVWASIVYDCNQFRATVPHTLPNTTDRLTRTLSKYLKEGYSVLIHGMYGRKNAAKVIGDEQKAFVEELIAHNNNLDNEQIANLYNMVCDKLNWKTISGSTVANYRKKSSLVAYAGQHGKSKFLDNKAMLVKRRAPKLPMEYWTLDGWDAELMYQQETKNKEGHNITTYFNRLTIVVVLDPCTKYPVGYAIGTHENTALIKSALKNAIQHTKLIFGGYYKPIQLQSDHYGRGALNDFYNSLSKHYTPARVKNAKAKVIEPYFKYLNKTYCQFMQNWSGFGLTANKDSQPNEDFKNLIKSNFPDINGAADQLHKIIYLERQAKLSKYQQLWLEVDDANKIPMTTEQYLAQFGETTGHTNRIESMGLCPTLLGEKRMYDCFDIQFRKLAHLDWVVKYEPTDLSTVVAESADGRYRFTLQQKYEQPMAIAERTKEDVAELTRIKGFNKSLTDEIIEQRAKNMELIQEVIEENPELNDTLAKMMLTDNKGQHKDQKNSKKVAAKELKKAQKQLEKKQDRQQIAVANEVDEDYEYYLNEEFNRRN